MRCSRALRFRRTLIESTIPALFSKNCVPSMTVKKPHLERNATAHDQVIADRWGSGVTLHPTFLCQSFFLPRTNHFKNLKHHQPPSPRGGGGASACLHVNKMFDIVAALSLSNVETMETTAFQIQGDRHFSWCEIFFRVRKKTCKVERNVEIISGLVKNESSSLNTENNDMV